MANIVYLKGAIANRIVQLQKTRNDLYAKFRKMTTDMYLLRRDLEQTDRDISYWRKVLGKMNDDN